MLMLQVHRLRSKDNEELSAVHHDYDGADHQEDNEEVNEDITADLDEVSTSSVLVQASRERIEEPNDNEKKYFKFKSEDFKLVGNIVLHSNILTFLMQLYLPLFMSNQSQCIVKILVTFILV